MADCCFAVAPAPVKSLYSRQQSNTMEYFASPRTPPPPPPPPQSLNSPLRDGGKMQRQTTIVASGKPKKVRVSHGDPLMQRLTREERRRRRRCTEKYRNAHATRERARIEAFNHGFGELRKLLPVLPPDKKLSKIEILRLAICYIAYLTHVLET
ncbi:hypothetical protein BV898_08253 [Hypsibius exemplaris]|uniref:BHLH domain-containing protein n=1 Tax=Hypsibius exemplaris TaxID=2072580 RepID=A0A1W0WR13_HYPEX|nr:hypothetical protein BV898_08253 [Hypsibius exemplaris]